VGLDQQLIAEFEGLLHLTILTIRGVPGKRSSTGEDT
jgi:hypothetical protein